MSIKHKYDNADETNPKETAFDQFIDEQHTQERLREEMFKKPKYEETDVQTLYKEVLDQQDKLEEQKNYN